MNFKSEQNTKHGALSFHNCGKLENELLSWISLIYKTLYFILFYSHFLCVSKCLWSQH